MDNRSQRKEIPFSGKLMTSDPATIGQNFQTLKNLRYTDTHVKGIAGIGKITSSVINAVYSKVRSAFHFLKSNPFESHILVQAYNSPLTGAAVYDCVTAPPTSAAFSSAAHITDSSGFGTGRFSDAPDGQMIYCNGIDVSIWGGEETKIGALIVMTAAITSAASAPVNPMDYTEQAQNTKSDNPNIFTCSTSVPSFLIGCNRPAQGAKIYVSSANTSANTLVVRESTDSHWNSLTITADTTRVGGKSFAQSGKVSWASAVSTTKRRYLHGYYLYWYQFSVDAGSANIYHVTLDLPWQPMIDMWDGSYRDVVRCYTYNSSGAARSDITTKVLYDDYVAGSTDTYADIGSFATTQSLEIGFTEKQTAVFVKFAPANTNSNAAEIGVAYWDGTQWVAIAAVTDGTYSGSASFSSSGVVSWYNTSTSDEQKKVFFGDTPYYYYRLTFNGALDASVVIDYIGGIPLSKSISHFKFPVFAQGRVFLCADMAQDRNKALVSAKYMPQVYNGEDSIDVYFGDEGELTCGVELFSQYGSSLYSLVLFFKDTETWVVAGQEIAQWNQNTFLLSSSIGCPAPLTLKTINLRAEPGAGVNRVLAIWQGSNGIYMSDGRAPIPIHGDIEEYFDPLDSRCIKYSKVGDSVGTIDHVNQVYMWKFASGSSATTLNKELHYDIKRNKWYEVERPTDLQCGLAVKDADGNFYTYGFTDAGYMYRLESGTDFDGTPIKSTVHFGDMALAGLGTETRVSHIKLIEVAKTAALSSAVVTHYADGSTTGTEMSMSPVKSGHRIAQPKQDEKLDADPFHSIKIEMTTNNETCGIEPIAAVITFHPTHND